MLGKCLLNRRGTIMIAIEKDNSWRKIYEKSISNRNTEETQKKSRIELRVSDCN